MLSPLSGLHAVIKRRSSKARRRDSFSMSPSTLPVPGESTIRRFSSTETLSGAHLQAPAPSVATVTRKSSISRRIRKVSSGSNHHQADCPDPCSLLDMRIAQIKRKLADFREEDVEISERVEELTNCLGDLCQDYHISSPPVVLCPEATYQQLHAEPEQTSSGEESDEREFVQFCQKHHGVQQPAGTHTLPLPRRRPPPPPPPFMGLSTSASTTTFRSQSHERIENSGWSNVLTPATNHNMLHPQHANYHQDTRNYYLRANSCQDSGYHPSRPLSYQDSSCRSRPLSYQDSSHQSRPLSYQEIAYDENDFEETTILGLEDSKWAELSCP